MGMKKLKEEEVKKMEKILKHHSLEATRTTVAYIKNGMKELLKLEVVEKDSNGKEYKRHLNINEFIHNFISYLDTLEESIIKEQDKNV